MTDNLYDSLGRKTTDAPGRATKNVYSAPGQLRARYIVQSIRNGRRFTTEETGYNSAFNIKQAVEDRTFIEKARLNAIYHHMAKGGNSSATTTLIDYEIKYFSGLTRFEKRNYKNGEYTVVLDAKSGKVLSRTKKKTRLEIE